MREVKFEPIALFFFFAFMDDRKITEASILACSVFDKKKKESLKLSDEVLIVMSTFVVWSKNCLKSNEGNINFSNDGGWIIPTGIDLGPWREFQKLATQEELLVVIWSKILGLQDKHIAKGIGISEGTVRYRLARALRKLGNMVQGTPTKRLSMVQ
ncbi:MAG: sigma-70 region 4 domain-containing protein [Bdellovibrionaceae bacterium]|nr:sigma-70 region 4 domain-containing protein [Pseudobdellovibrionaceae bacterium]